MIGLRRTWGEQEPGAQLLVLVVGGAAQTVVSWHSGVDPQAADATGGRHGGSEVLLEQWQSIKQTEKQEDEGVGLQHAARTAAAGVVVVVVFLVFFF